MKPFLKKMFIVIAKIFYSLICAVVSLFILSSMFVVTAESQIALENTDIQIIFFLIISLIVIISLWWLVFVRTKLKTKIIIIILFFVYLFGFSKIPSVKKALDAEVCLDTGICSEGIKTKIEGELFEISKENCLKYHRVWNEKRKECKIR